MGIKETISGIRHASPFHLTYVFSEDLLFLLFPAHRNLLFAGV
jgi:hypothetical protein